MRGNQRGRSFEGTKENEKKEMRWGRRNWCRVSRKREGRSWLDGLGHYLISMSPRSGERLLQREEGQK